MKYDGTNFDEVIMKTNCDHDDKMDFSDTKLVDKVFNAVDLTGANFKKCKLFNCHFYSCKLTDVDFRQCEMVDCSFYNCHGHDSWLHYALIRHSGFYDCSFLNFVMECAKVICSRISSCSFAEVFDRELDLTGTYVFDTRWFNPKNYTSKIIGAPIAERICPSHGAFIGWKVCVGFVDCYDSISPDNGYVNTFKRLQNVIVKLQIPASAERSNGFGRKCRCSKAKVLSFETLSGKKINQKDIHVVSKHDSTFVYKLGETVVPDAFDHDRFRTCSSGIHFFITRAEAVDYARNC